jgi:metal transporter CNNM
MSSFNNATLDREISLLWLATTKIPLEESAQALVWVAVIILVLMSGLFSGLTLGLLGLDPMGLEIIIKGSEDPQERKNAKIIYKVRKEGNLLLCTLLLGNVAVNSMLAILSADIFDGTVGFLASTATIVIFGEIIPQAVCARYALAIGARTVWLVQIFKYILIIITWPMAKCLDKILGAEMGTVHSSTEMAVLFEKYVEQGNMEGEQAEMMTGALTYKDKEASSVMTTRDKIFTLSINDKLDFRALSSIFKSGFSRIPVLGRDENHVVGMILTKDLILIDTEEEHTVKAAMQLFGRNVHQIFPDMKLPAVLQMFKSGKGHLAVVMDVNNEGEGDPVYEIVGLVTLEDIIEEILHTEIVDETDVYIHMEAGDKVSRDSFDVARLRILDSNNQSTTLGTDEARAVAAHLIANVGAFRDAYVINSSDETKSGGGKLTSAAVMKMLTKCQVLELKEKEWLLSIDEEVR